jgi:hypothetical protein
MSTGTRKPVKLIAMIVFLLVLTGLPALASAHVRTHLWIGVGPWWGPWYYTAPWYPVYTYPVAVPAPAPCRSVWVEGHWERRSFSDDRGFRTYRDAWVPGHWERFCP